MYTNIFQSQYKNSKESCVPNPIKNVKDVTKGLTGYTVWLHTSDVAQFTQYSLRTVADLHVIVTQTVSGAMAINEHRPYFSGDRQKNTGQ